MTVIQVVWYPPRLSTPSAHICNNVDKQRTQVVAKCSSCEGKSWAQAPHGIGGLLIEEFQLSNEGENFCATYDEVLWDLPKYWHGDVLELVVVVFPHHAQSQELQSTGNQHGKDGDDQANCYPLKLGETAFVACEFPGKRYDQTVIDGDPEDHADGVEEWERGWRNLEGAGNAKVHSVALEDK